MLAFCLIEYLVCILFMKMMFSFKFCWASVVLFCFCSLEKLHGIELASNVIVPVGVLFYIRMVLREILVYDNGIFTLILI